MFKLLPSTLAVLFLFLWLKSIGQQPVLEVKSLEYIWQKDFVAMTASATPRAIIPLDDSAKFLIKNCFARAIQDRWNIVMPEASLSVRPLSMLANAPKFKTRIKDNEPGKWYLFLQVYDKGKFPDFFSDEDSLSTTLELRCRIVSGNNDSVIIDRVLMVNIYKEMPPPDQVALTRLPAYPASFVGAFDSIAGWLFQPEPISQKSLRLRTACVFQETGTGDKLTTQLSFKTDNENIQQLIAPAFSFRTPGPKYERIDAKRNRGGNVASGALTLFTGIQSNKSRSFVYKADFPFEEGDSIFHCLIGYVEKETAEQERVSVNDIGTKSSSVKSTYYKLLARYPDSAFSNSVTLAGDTLIKFSIRYENESVARTTYSRMWDGIDSATITPLPPAWNNKEEETNVALLGKINGKFFAMRTSKETRIKEFFVNDQLEAVIQGKNKPIRAFVLPSISTLQLKLFTILSSLNYAYFNESHLN
ncbi:MAG: hypothetical protein ABI760_02220 [Ferruginibacter sp.]